LYADEAIRYASSGRIVITMAFDATVNIFNARAGDTENRALSRGFPLDVKFSNIERAVQPSFVNMALRSVLKSTATPAGITFGSVYNGAVNVVGHGEGAGIAEVVSGSSQLACFIQVATSWTTLLCGFGFPCPGYNATTVSCEKER
jgi:hypothetical protein